MSVEKITFYLRSYDRDHVIELLEQKSELMKKMVSSLDSNELDRFGRALANRSLNISYDPMPKVEEEE